MKPLVDWFCCSFKAVKIFDEILQYFMLKKDDFKPATFTNHYQYGLWWNNISVWYNINDKHDDLILNPDSDYSWTTYDICISMSGQGCRSYETLRGDGFDWVTFFRQLHDGFAPDCYNVSRLDVAFDVRDDSVPTMLKIIQCVNGRKYVSQFRRHISITGDEEQVNFGSPQSKTRLRIYNKALERGFPDTEKWVRFEYQLRDISADRFLNHLYHCDSLGRAFKDFINESVKFTIKPNIASIANHNQGRLNAVGWWKNFVKGAGKVTRFETPGVEYNMAACQKYLDTQAGNSLYTFVAGHGGDITPLIEIIQQHEDRINDKQKALIRQQQAQQNLDQMRAELFGG